MDCTAASSAGSIALTSAIARASRPWATWPMNSTPSMPGMSRSTSTTSGGSGMRCSMSKAATPPGASWIVPTPISPSIRSAILRWKPWSSTTSTCMSDRLIASPRCGRPRGAYRKTRKAKSRPRGRLFMALAMEVRLRRGGDDVPALARRAGRGQDLVRAPPVAGERLALGEELVVVGVGEHELAVLEPVDHLAGDRLAQRRATPAAAGAAERGEVGRVHVVGTVDHDRAAAGVVVEAFVLAVHAQRIAVAAVV